jgi:hypothetical protein
MGRSSSHVHPGGTQDSLTARQAVQFRGLISGKPGALAVLHATSGANAGNCVSSWYRFLGLHCSLFEPSDMATIWLPLSIDLDRIADTEAHRMEHNWGRQFHGNDPPPGFSTNQHILDAYLAELHPQDEDQGPVEEIPAELLRNIYDVADLGPYGPALHPKEFAEVVVGIEIPNDQNCTICAETFEWWNTRNRCLKLQGCGHYFHEECLRQWIIGVAPNSNPCPECRTEICSNRRPVRVKGTPGAPLSDVTPPDDDPSSELTEESQVEDEQSEGEQDPTEVPDPLVFDFEYPSRSKSPCDLDGTNSELVEPEEGEQTDEIPHRDYRFAVANDDSEYDEDPIGGGYTLSGPGDIETFQPAGLMHRATSLTYVQPEELMDSEGNLFPDRWTGRTHRPEPEPAFEYDMDKDEYDDDFQYPGWATGMPECEFEP